MFFYRRSIGQLYHCDTDKDTVSDIVLSDKKTTALNPTIVSSGGGGRGVSLVF